MRKLDRLGWAAGMSFVSYGLRIGIRVSDPEAMDRLPDLLPPSVKPARGPKVERLYSIVVGGNGSSRAGTRRFNLLYANAVRMARSMELNQVLQALESDLQLYVAEGARRRLFVHAGVVGWRGRAIIIPGRSFTGKSTLVAALVRAGATYYSDEYAVIDSRGRVHPYARPLALRHEPEGRASKFRPEDLGGPPGIKPLPVGLIVLTSHRPGAQWRPRPMPQGRAVMALLAHTVAARRDPQRALATLPHVASQALVLKGARGEAEEMVNSLLRKASERATGISAGN